ncbi:hypothetical protein PUN28_010776 [Cardiocondyla obscurior]|uniref:Uncharacterized protein n=1 Tax=Cardiocondyla obscurior TaxID=286306 RepID=A0AAW2FJ88_9HYME
MVPRRDEAIRFRRKHGGVANRRRRFTFINASSRDIDKTFSLPLGWSRDWSRGYIKRAHHRRGRREKTFSASGVFSSIVLLYRNVSNDRERAGRERKGEERRFFISLRSFLFNHACIITSNYIARVIIR